MWIFGRHRHLSADRLSEYLGGRLTRQESSRIEGALEECDQCREELESLRETRSLLRALPDFALPRSFVLPAAPAHIPASGPARSAIGWPRVPVWAYAGAASVAAVAIFLVVVTDGGGWLPGGPATQSSEPASELAMVVSEPSSEAAALAPAQQMAADNLPQEELAAVPQSMPAPQPAAASEIPVEQEATVAMEREVVAEVESIREIPVERSVEVLQESTPTPAAMAQESMAQIDRAQTESSPEGASVPTESDSEPVPTPDSALLPEPTAVAESAAAPALAASPTATPQPTAVPGAASVKMGEASTAGREVPTPTLGPLATAAPPPWLSEAGLPTTQPDRPDQPGDERGAEATPPGQARGPSAGRPGPTMVFTPAPTVAPAAGEGEATGGDMGASPDAISQTPTPQPAPVPSKETDALEPEAQPAASKGVAGSEASPEPLLRSEPTPETASPEAEESVPAVAKAFPSETPHSLGAAKAEGEDLTEAERETLAPGSTAEEAPSGKQGGPEDYQGAVEEAPGLNWLLAFAVTTTVLAVLAIVVITGLRRWRARNSTGGLGTKDEGIPS